MFYKLAWVLLKIYFFVFFRFKSSGRENIPETGGTIFCSNHSSMMDPTILAMLTRRKVHYIGKKELFDKRFAAPFLRWLGAFPVDRGAADMSAYKKAIELLANGGVVGVFAEGSRFKELDAKNAKAGVALFALKSGAEVVPIAIKSSYKLFSKITVNVGAPVGLGEYRGARIKTETLNAATEKIMNEISGLM